jgi:hypothetical protein
MAEETEKLCHTVSVNLTVDNYGLRRDLVVNANNPSIIIDVTVPLSSVNGLEKAQARKMGKYTTRWCGTPSHALKQRWDKSCPGIVW